MSNSTMTKSCDNRQVTKEYEPGLVSVIIPTHNRATMLRRAIESVLAQTWQGDFEIIVVSDGSEDKTDEVVGSFNDPRIRFFKHETARGASAARNAGLRAASGEYIAFLDDDEWTVDKLEVQMPIIENSGPEVGLVYTWMESFCDGQSVHLYAPVLRGNVFEQMLGGQVIGGCPTVVIKRKVIDVVGGFDEELPRGNDGDFIRRISRRFEVNYVPAVHTKVHVGHSDRISINSVRNLKNCAIALEKRLRTFKDDFEKFAGQKAVVLERLGTAYMNTGQLKKGIGCLWKMLGCDVNLCEKTRLVFRAVRGFMGFKLRQIAGIIKR